MSETLSPNSMVLIPPKDSNMREYAGDDMGDSVGDGNVVMSVVGVRSDPDSVKLCEALKHSKCRLGRKKSEEINLKAEERL